MTNLIASRRELFGLEGPGQDWVLVLSRNPALY